MNLYKITAATALIVTGSLFLLSCQKEKEPKAKESDLRQKTMIKVYSAALNTTRNYVYIDLAPITGAALAYGGVFPSGVGTYYAAIDPGAHSILIKDTLASSTQTQVNISASFDAGKTYTIFLYDTSNNVKQKTVLDTLVIPNDTTARVRFANLAYSKSAMPNLDIYSFKKAGNVLTNISPTQITGFFPFASNTLDTFYIRATGTTVDLAKLGFTLTQKRSYTFVFRGRYDIPTSGTLGRTLSSFTNY